MLSTAVFNVLIVGAGNIGAFYDNPESKNVLTHAHAFYKHLNFQIIGFIDINESKAENAAQIWGGKKFINIKDAFNESNIDVVVNDTPDEFHFIP